MRMSWMVAAAAGLVAFAGLASADDDVRSEIEALKRQVESQDRKIRELEGRSMTQDEVGAAVDRYLSTASSPSTLVGGGDGGSAGFPMGGAPFIAEGPNKINFHVRNQVRYEWFRYSNDAVGTLASPPNTISDAAPRDRSGFEIERLYLAVDGSVF